MITHYIIGSLGTSRTTQPFKAMADQRAAQRHLCLRELRLSVAVRQEGFALSIIHCSITPWDLTNTEQESQRELMNLPWQ